MVNRIIGTAVLYLALPAILFAQAVSSPSRIDTRTSTSGGDQLVRLIEGKVVSVQEGDTIAVLVSGGDLYNIRIYGIDAPEEKQDDFKRSRKHLADLVLEKEVKIFLHKQDRDGRYIGRVYSGGNDVGLMQIERGMAWHALRSGYEQTAETRRVYSQAEAKARLYRLGLWKEDDPVAPWIFVARERPVDPEAANLSPEKPENVSSNAELAGEPASSSPPGRKYILGPRGGCYYISSSGSKVYVKDKSLCAQ